MYDTGHLLDRVAAGPWRGRGLATGGRTAVTAMCLGALALVAALVATVGAGTVDHVAWVDVGLWSLLGVIVAGWFLWRAHTRATDHGTARDTRVRIPRRVPGRRPHPRSAGARVMEGE